MKPWRHVTHIDIVDGPKGGRYWSLTLDCGHFAVRHAGRQPPTYSNRAILCKPASAPYKVRCYICPDLS